MTLTTALLLSIVALVIVVGLLVEQNQNYRYELAEYHAWNRELRQENAEILLRIHVLRLQLEDERVEARSKLIKEEE